MYTWFTMRCHSSSSTYFFLILSSLHLASHYLVCVDQIAGHTTFLMSIILRVLHVSLQIFQFIDVRIFWRLITTAEVGWGTNRSEPAPKLRRVSRNESVIRLSSRVYTSTRLYVYTESISRGLING